jgi:surface antigen
MRVLHLSALLAMLGASSGAAQDDPNDAARAEMELRQQQNMGGGSLGVTPNMGIVAVPTPAPTPERDIQQHAPEVRAPQSVDAFNDPNHDARRRREETFRNPRPPRYDDDHDHNPRPKKHRPPPVIVRPYYPPPIYVQPPPVIVRPYVPPPYYVQPYAPPLPWSGPVHADVVWGVFPADVYGSLHWRARDEHERAFIAALNAPVGETIRWREAGARGEITVIDERYFGSSFCRDVVQTIRLPWTTRTADGRVCIRPGQAWRLVAY